MTKKDRKTLEVVLFCPGCTSRSQSRLDVDRGADVLCARCYNDFKRWAGARMDSPSAQRYALTTWVRLKHLKGLP